MASKRYLLLKDTPEYKAGATFEELLGGPSKEYVCTESEKYGVTESIRRGKRGTTTYYQDVVESQPDWFEQQELVYIPSSMMEKFKAFIANIGK